MKRRSVIIKAGGGGPAEPVLSKQSVLADDVKSNAKGEKPAGFTMAEILLSLTIIGVVAAITLPSLTGNINERTWNTQRKALYARFSQAMALMPSLNGYGTLRESTDSAGSTSIEDTAAETFITSGLSKVLKINNICDNEHLQDCGIPSKITPLDGGDSYGGTINTTGITKLSGFNDYFVNFSVTTATDEFSYSQFNTKAAAFETANGESILVYYNPYCSSSDSAPKSFSATQPYMCANFVYDLNGTKGPNTVGKDIGFISALYPTDSVVVAPLPNLRSAGITNQRDAGKLCKNQDSESRLPNIDELTSLFYNKILIGIMPSSPWSSTLDYSSADTELKAWNMSFFSGRRGTYAVTQDREVWCIKR